LVHPAWIYLLGVLFLLAGSPQFAGAITANQLDNFQAGTLQNWSGGSSPTNIATGGPAGTGDRYLRISATSNFLGTFNLVQWSGNYVLAGIDQVSMNLNNFGPNAVSVRIMLFTPGCNAGATGCTAWTSTNATTLVSGSGWVSASFSVKEANLTRVLGSASYSSSLANIERLLIRHDSGTPTPPGSGEFVSATLGIDNVLPEPSGPLGLLVGAALLSAMPRRRTART